MDDDPAEAEDQDPHQDRVIPMSDLTPLHRQWVLLKTLCSRQYGLTVRAMAEEAGVNEKTIRRDLALFSSLGFALEETVGEFGRKQWRMKSAANQLPLSFTPDEMLALYLGRQLLEPLAGTPFWNSTHSAFRKIRAALSERALAYMQQLSCFFHPTAVGAGDYTRKAELIDYLTVSIEDSKAAHVLYQSERATEPAFRDVYPYGFVYHRNSLYLVALDPQEDKIKHYKVDRIESVEVSRFPFRRPSDFELARHLSPTFGIYHSDGPLISIKVRFAPAACRYVFESRWHHSQKLTKQRDGSLLAEFELSSTEEFRSWILSFGRKAVVLEPEELRREIAEELQVALASYVVPAAHLAQPSEPRRGRSDPIRRIPSDSSTRP